MRHFALLALLGFTGACGEFVGPDRGDPAQYAFRQAVVYGCAGWAPAMPPVALGLFDVIWGQSTEQELDLGPSAEQVKRVLDAGGTIVHRYNLIDQNLIVRVGGSVTRTYPFGTFVSAVVPDASIPLLRRDSNVR